MRKFIKSPLRVMVAGIFVVSIAIGVSTSTSSLTESGDVSLAGLGSVAAQGESGGGSGYYEQIDFCGAYTPGCHVWVIKCRYTGGPSCGVSSQWPCSIFCG